MERTAKTPSCLAITETRTTLNKPGGCVGIFFQLFDWNRRFAKKKLFSHKLLPPPRVKQFSNKFKGDEKMPSSKLHLITGENCGGFPNVKKNVNSHATDLDQKVEMRPPSLVARLMGLESMPSMTRDKSSKPSFSNTSGNGKQQFKGNHDGFSKEEISSDKNKNEIVRPQKLQRTGFCEKKAVTRVGNEALQMKSVLSSKSRRNQNHPKLNSPMKSPRFSSGKNASKTCSRLLDAATRILEPGLQGRNRAEFALSHSNSMSYSSNDKAMEEDQPSVFPSFGSDSSNVVSSGGLERSRVRFDLPTHFACRENEDKCNIVKSHSEPLAGEKMALYREVQYPWLAQCKQLQKDESSSSVAFKPMNQSQIQLSLGRDRVTLRSKKSTSPYSKRVSLNSNLNPINGSKDFVVLNRSLSGPTRVESSKLNSRRKAFNDRENSSESSVRKRRTANAGVHIDHRVCLSQSSMNRTGVISRMGNHQQEGKRAIRKDNDVVSFTFNSTMRNKIEILQKAEDKTMINEKRLQMGGDAIGALLQQKLKELTCQEEDDKRSTAMILQELISALTAEQPISHEGSMVNSEAEEKVGRSMRMSSKDVDHFSPGSVLEASFSSSSLDDGSGHMFTDSMEFISEQNQPMESDYDIFDSATSLNQGNNKSDDVWTSTSNDISSILSTINLDGIRLEGSKLDYAKEVLLNSELLFGTWTQQFLKELETISNSEDADKERNNPGKAGFLFDSLIECLDSKCARFCNSGLSTLTRMPFLCLSARNVIEDVENEIRKWSGFAGMSLDEIIEWEMSHSLGKWTDFGIEAFETGTEIDGDILRNLVEEILIDIC